MASVCTGHWSSENYTRCIILKEQSRPFVSNVTSADVRMTTQLNSVTSLVNVMKSV